MNYRSAKIFDADGDLSKRWFVFYYFRCPETNKFVRFRTWIGSNYVTRPERYARGKEIKNEINAKLQNGFNPFSINNRPLSCIEKVLDDYISVKKETNRRRTYGSYRSYIEHFKKWLYDKKYNHLPVEAINFDHANAYVEDLLKTKHPSNRTYNNYLQALSTCFNYLVSKQYLIVNPFSSISRLQEEEPEIIAFSRAELDLLKENLPSFDHNLYVIALLIFNGFMRPQEIVRLRVRQLQHISNYLNIPGNISKNKHDQTIAIPDQLIFEIKKMNLGYPGNYFVFSTHLMPGEREIAPTRIAERWREFANIHNIEKNIYALKHTGNGFALDAGANTRDLQLQNRHKSMDETQKYLDRVRRIPSQKFIQSLPRL